MERSLYHRRRRPSMTPAPPPSPPRLSALVVAHDEAAQLADCLATLAFADELVVVLDGCTDGSKAIAERYAARLVEGRWPIEGPRRRAGIDACAGPWILEIDADERVTPALAAEIRAYVATASPGCCGVPIANHVGGRLVRYGWGAYNGVAEKPILFAKGMKVWGDDRVHPRIALAGARGRLTERLIHHVDRDLSDMLRRLDRYTTARAQDLAERGDPGRLAPNVRRVATRFWKSYVGRAGWREGGVGIMLGLFAGLYPLLAHLKAREILERRGDAPRQAADGEI